MKTFKIVFLCIYLLCGAAVLMAQAPSWQWATAVGGTDNEFNVGWSIKIDNQGNQYVAGWFTGTLTFGSHTLTASAGEPGEPPRDIFVAKRDAGGDWLWAVGAHVSNNKIMFGFALDAEGNTYLAGTFYETSSFGSHSLTSSGAEDVFVAKINADGNWLWAVRAGGPEQDEGYDLALDSEGNAYITGRFGGTVAFGNHSLTSSGEGDVFVAKLNPGGNWLWAVKAGGSLKDEGYCITSDGAGNTYVTGEFSGTATFGSHTLTASGEDNIFVAKLNSGGSWLWAAKAAGSNGLDLADIASDSLGNAYVTGAFLFTVTFGEDTLTTNVNDEVFVAKLSPDGNWLWAVQSEGELHNRGFEIVLDNADNIYTTGFCYDSVTFGDHTLTSSGEHDVFVAKLSPEGSWLWVAQAGGPGIDAGCGIALDRAGNAYVTGVFSNAATFGDHTLTAGGMLAIFVAKLGDHTPVDDYLAPQIASRLHDAWPNPFGRGASATIKADVPERSTGTLSIYNLRGQRVASYELNSGSHELNFSGENLPAGIYFYSLQCGTFRETKKLVLLK